jgi:serine protease
MRTKLFILFTILMLVPSKIVSQTHYYYRDSKKQEILLDKKHINLFVNSSFNKTELANLGFTSPIWYNNELQPNEQWATLVLETEPTDVEYLQKTTKLKNMLGVTGVAKHFKNDNYKSVGTSNLFYVKLKSLADTVTLKRIAIEKKVSIHHQLQYIPEWFALQRNIDAPSDALELSNQFFETQLFENVDPNFLFELMIPDPGPDPQEPCDFESSNSSCVDDALISNQWGLFNEEHPNTDINMCQAWDISTGANTKIAIIDTGVQLNHPDLINNIAPQSFDANNNTSPSQVYSFHGTFVAGICGAGTNNNQGIAGVAPNTKIISVSHPLSGQPQLTTCEKMGGGIYWAAFGPEKADIMNNSWGIQSTTLSSAVLENNITLATSNGRLGKGCIVVFAAGNDMYGMRYPANNPNLNLLTVGASRPDGLKATFSSHGPTLDVVAPGVCIPSTTIGSSVATDDGTSFAAPHVAGVAALMLSVNPCLTRQQVYDIIEQTAQKLSPATYAYATTPNKPNGTWNSKVGYGLLDAYAATQMAKTLAGTRLDLFIKDNTADLGAEPNTTSTSLWNSPNIWVRNNQDGLTTHQAPRYNQTTPNYVYVKVENKSCFPTTGNEQIQLFYSRPTTGTPTSTSAAFRSSFAPVTGTEWVFIGSVNMPILAAGKGATLDIPWMLPDPIGMYGCTSTTFNTSLLAKIVDTTDNNNAAETTNVLTNIINNNNIAGKSLIAIDADYFTSNQGDTSTNSILIANPYNEPHSFSIEMIKEDSETGKPIYQEAEVSFKMDDALYNAWERGGKTAQNIESTTVESKKMVTNNNVLINTISLNANELTTLKLNFNFLTDELTDKSKYTYHIIQRDLATNEIVSAVAFEINKEPRPIFEAVADDIEKDRNEIITISAEQISEPALYNWYDTDGNLIYQGKDLTVATDVAQKYKLEVIATADGFKDYTEVEVTLKPSVLSTITPNPATDAVTIGYKINEGGTAYLMILGGYGSDSSSNNYIVNPDLGEIKINLANYSNGFYTVALVVNGQIIDAKTLVKQ